jgi:hypothetical protein
MNKNYAVLISILIVVVPLGILYYLTSYGIVNLFGKEVYAFAIFIIAIMFLAWEFCKKLRRKK